jgi:hypothetical protein
MPSSNERRVMEIAAGEMSAEESEALARVPIFCVLRAAGRFVLCGVTDPDCQRRFLDDVIGCFEGDGGS